VTADWARFYDDLADDYDAMTAGAAWSPNDGAAGLLAPLGLTPARILDLGAGTGQTARMLRDMHPGARLTLVEPSHGMLALAGRKLPGARVVLDDAAGFLSRTDETWDLIAALGFLELVPDLVELLRLAAGRLAPGGHLVVSHEPLLDDGSVQASPVSVVGGEHRVRRHRREEVERRAASYGLRRIASHEGFAFERSDDGPTVYELVVWRADDT
jgi:predicted TPR repeat methyltransferase